MTADTPAADERQRASWFRSRPAVDRFWEKVEIGADTECWPWTGAVGSDGYGNFTLEKVGGWRGQEIRVLAHRFAYELERDLIPPGLTIDHLCRVRRCVNPGHLEAVTLAENKARGLRGRGRFPLTHCRRGHEFTPANTRWNLRTTGRMFRSCVACQRLRHPSQSERDLGHTKPARTSGTERITYLVSIARLHDTDERDVIRVVAYGEQDIRQQVREFHPGWYVRGWDEVRGG